MMRPLLFSVILLAGCVQPVTPPVPVPTPSPGPVLPDIPPAPPVVKPVDLWVLIIEETAERHKLSVNQLAIISGPAVRKWCEDRTKSGKPTHFRIFDKDADTQHAENVWKEGVKLPIGGTPWIHVSNGKDGTSQKLPDSPEAVISLLDKYGHIVQSWGVAC